MGGAHRHPQGGEGECGQRPHSHGPSWQSASLQGGQQRSLCVQGRQSMGAVRERRPVMSAGHGHPSSEAPTAVGALHGTHHRPPVQGNRKWPSGQVGPQLVGLPVRVAVRGSRSRGRACRCASAAALRCVLARVACVRRACGWPYCMWFNLFGACLCLCARGAQADVSAAPQTDSLRLSACVDAGGVRIA